MFSWLSKEGQKQELYENVVAGLKKIYHAKLLPLEQHYQFHDFHSPQLEDPNFDAKPMILLVGQYSTGKTTFIKHLLERDFPDIRIGPEPTTDHFIAVMHGEKEGIIPGNVLVMDAKKQFKQLSKFGNAFLNRFKCSTVASPVLEGISIIDTPGILSGEKQRVDRGYDFTGVLEWFAERVDRIILLFDAHKLDISDEFHRAIEALKDHGDKIHIVLNKADTIDHQELIRIYGALMWSLGKVLQTPEVARVYVGSFWNEPYVNDINRRLFEDEEHDLFQDIHSLPSNAALRKLNDLIKRARLAKVHAYIISELRNEMPFMFGIEAKKKELIENLDQIYYKIQVEQHIPPGDFPDIKQMQKLLVNHNFHKFRPIKQKLLDAIDQMLAEDISALMDMIPHENAKVVTEPEDISVPMDMIPHENAKVGTEPEDISAIMDMIPHENAKVVTEPEDISVPMDMIPHENAKVVTEPEDISVPMDMIPHENAKVDTEPEDISAIMDMIPHENGKVVTEPDDISAPIDMIHHENVNVVEGEKNNFIILPPILFSHHMLTCLICVLVFIYFISSQFYLYVLLPPAKPVEKEYDIVLKWINSFTF